MLLQLSKKFFVGALLAMFINCFFLFLKVEAVTLEEVQKQIAEMEKQVNSLEEVSSSYQRIVNEKQKNISTLSNTIVIFSNKVKKLENDIYLTGQEIKLKNLLIQSLEIEIDKTSLDIKEKRSVLSGLIKAVNDYDKKGAIEILFEGDKLSDFFDQARYLEIINTNLNGALNDVKNLKDELEDKKIASEKEKKGLEELKEKTSIQKYALNQEKSDQQKILSQTKGEEAQYQSLLSETSRKRAELLKEISVLEKEVERQKSFLYYAEAGRIPPAGTVIFRWPESKTILTQGYGMTNFAKTGAYGGAGHNGIDMAAGIGSSIMAAADGEIFVSGYNSGWGNWVAIKHQNNMVTLYAHMIKSTLRKMGERVSAGDVVGYEGSTGFSTGSHLHFSVYNKFFTYTKNDQIYFNYFDGTLNPLNYL